MLVHVAPEPTGATGKQVDPNSHRAQGFVAVAAVAKGVEIRTVAGAPVVKGVDAPCARRICGFAIGNINPTCAVGQVLPKC